MRKKGSSSGGTLLKGSNDLGTEVSLSDNHDNKAGRFPDSSSSESQRSGDRSETTVRRTEERVPSACAAIENHRNGVIMRRRAKPASPAQSEEFASGPANGAGVHNRETELLRELAKALAREAARETFERALAQLDLANAEEAE